MERQGLRVLDGRLSDRTRRDEARIEAIAAIDRAIDFTVMAETRLRESLGQVIQFREASVAAKAEALALGGSNDAA